MWEREKMAAGALEGGRLEGLPDRFLVQREWCILLSHDSLLPQVRLGVWASPYSRAVLRVLSWQLGFGGI